MFHIPLLACKVSKGRSHNWFELYVYPNAQQSVLNTKYLMFDMFAELYNVLGGFLQKSLLIFKDDTFSSPLKIRILSS